MTTIKLARLLFVVHLVVPILKIVNLSEGLVLAFTDSENSEHLRQERSQEPKFKAGPNGDLCVLNYDYHSYYDHTDEFGRVCECEVCPRGKILVENCTCDDPDVYQVTSCELVEQGKQMMKFRNKCEVGFDCKQCDHPWSIKTACGPAGPDTVCECTAPGYYLVTSEDCRQIPRCNKGYEPVVGFGEYGSEMRCHECRTGYYQPDNNSTSRCRMHRVCTVEEGTSDTDTQCMNDPELEHLATEMPDEDSIKNPAEESEPPETSSSDVMNSDEPVSDAPVSDEPVSDATTQCPCTSPLFTNGSLGSDSDGNDDSASSTWTSHIFIATHVLSFIMGMCVWNINKIWQFLSGRCSQALCTSSHQELPSHEMEVLDKGSSKVTTQTTDHTKEESRTRSNSTSNRKSKRQKSK